MSSARAGRAGFSPLSTIHRKAISAVAGLALMTLFAPHAHAADCNPSTNATLSVVSPLATSVTEGGTVTLTGQGTPQNANRTYSYSWLQTSGPAIVNPSASIDAQGKAVLTFTAPNVLAAGATVTVQLTATPTSCTGAPGTRSVSITVLDSAPINLAPAANAGTDQTVDEGQQVTLSGAGSTDPDGDELTYTWKQIGGPSVSLQANGTTATFVAPDIYPSASETLTFELEVSDGVLSSTDTVNVTVRWTNEPPVARLSCPVQVNERASFSLNGSASTDPDDGIASYSWLQWQAPPVVNGLPETTLPPTSSLSLVAPSLGAGQTGDVSFKLIVTDKTGAFSQATCALNIRDITPPQLTLPGPLSAEATGPSGASVSFTVTSLDARDEAATPAPTCSHASGSVFPLGTTTVNCTGSDLAGNTSTGSFTVTVVDTTPPDTSFVTTPANPSNSPSLFSFTGSDVVTSAANLQFECSLDGAAYGACLTSYTLPRGPHTLAVRARDQAGNVDPTPATQSWTVNGPPENVQVAPSAASVNEGSAMSVSGSFSDAYDNGQHTVAIDWGDGTTPTQLTVAAGVTTFSANHTYAEGPANRAISVTVTDSLGLSGNGGTAVQVNNVAPSITSLTGPTGPLAAPATTSIGVTFTDPGVLDTHNCTFVWDDNTTTTVAASSGACQAAHTYNAAGVYAVSVTVADDDGGSAGTRFEYVVVYDPSAGFVTGGGWIASPAGAYRPNPALTGKANFGFVSKYQRGSTVPTGETEFQFQTASFRFNSTSYEWLVVAGYKAQYKGIGMVNGVPGYSFLLSANDGQAPGGGGVDKIRIKIWNAGGVVYDNNVNGAPDDIDSADPQAIGGGSITIHSK